MQRQIKTKEGSESMWEYARENMLERNLESGAIILD